MRILIASLMALTVSGCASWFSDDQPRPPVEIVTREIPQRIYQPPAPNPLQLEDVEWFVITEENFEEQLGRLQELQGGGWVIFAITPQDYENMAYNFQEMRRYIRQQGEIIIYYREATDPGDAEEWLEENAPAQPNNG